MGASASAPVGNGQFRKKIEQNVEVIMPSDLTHTGTFGDYFFVTGEEKVKDFAPSYSFAVVKDPITSQIEHYLCVGLNSKFDGAGIKLFGRPRVQLVIALDVSGSMNCEFDRGDQTKSKLEIAKTSLITLTSHLQAGDMLGVVTFNEDCHVIQPLMEWSEIDRDKLLKAVKSLEPGGGTSLSAGYTGATSLFDSVRRSASAAPDAQAHTGELPQAGPVERRVMFLTDMNPSMGETKPDGLFGIAQRCAKVGIYSTFIGVGLDFNTELVTYITQSILGASYLCVLSDDDFRTQMADDFDYLVTPLVFNLKLKLNSAKGVVIDKIYGSPDADITSGELMKVGTLFASNRNKLGETKGGVILIKLKFDTKQLEGVAKASKSQQQPAAQTVGEKDNTKPVAEGGESKQQQVEGSGEEHKGGEGAGGEVAEEAEEDEDHHNKDPDEVANKEGHVDRVKLQLSMSFTTRDSEGVTTVNSDVLLHLQQPNHYDNNGVRKAVLLTQYVNLMKDTISPKSAKSISVQTEERKQLDLFTDHFTKEMAVLQDDTLKRELNVLKRTQTKMNVAAAAPVNATETS